MKTRQKRFPYPLPLWPAVDASPVQRVDKIFRNMDRDKDAKLTYEEFVEGSKQDPTIVQVCGPSDYLGISLTSPLPRHYHYMMA